jgi:peptide/nickel transport system ATP-binding protein
LVKPLLQVKNFSVTFTNDEGQVKAVNNISFNLAKGKVTAVVGESGSGKSVTAMSMVQLHSPKHTNYNGELLWHNEEQYTDLLRLDKKNLHQYRGGKISIIFQEPMTSLNPTTTVGQQVQEALLLHSSVTKTQAKEKVIELFEKVKLPIPVALYNRYPHELSGGQKQRVMIAMALITNPELLICDEPTTALDVTVQKEILLLIKELQGKYALTIMFITHDLGVVQQIADNVVVMYRGEIVEQGTVEQVFSNPQTNYTKALLKCRPVLYSSNVVLPTVEDFMHLKIGESFTPKLQEHNAKKTEEVFIEVKNLTVKYPTEKNIFGKAKNYFTAVNNVSFTINKGDVVGLVGESGCGKSTLGRTLLRLNENYDGEIILQGNNYKNISLNKQFRKQVQIVFQDPYSSLNPKKTIGDAIKECIVTQQIENRKNAKDKTIHLLELVELKPDYYNRYPHEFSGGQRQRIVIARALSVAPEFIVFDESVAALDVSIQAQILNLINSLKNTLGFTALFISHDLSVVKYISNEVLVMEKGIIVENNSAEQLFAQPAHQYTKKLLDAVYK